MKNELYFYDIFPKAVPAGREISVRIRSLSPHTAFTLEE